MYRCGLGGLSCNKEMPALRLAMPLMFILFYYKFNVALALWIAVKRRRGAWLSAHEKGAMYINALQCLSSDNDRIWGFSTLQMADFQDRGKGQGVLLCKKTNIVGCSFAVGDSLTCLRACTSNHNCRGS